MCYEETYGNYYEGTFSEVYKQLLNDITFKQFYFNSTCNNNKMLFEMLNVELHIKMLNNNIYMYSHELTKALPIAFTLAEFLTILTNDENITHLGTFNKSILNYCDKNINGQYYSNHYGTRIYMQLPDVLRTLQNDKHTRQACANIWEHLELYNKHKSCNIFLQFIIRNNKLDLVVISRSSDLLTGLQIDSFHWQALLLLFYNELVFTYPDLQLGYIIYKITSLHIYEKDKFMFDYLEERQPLIEKYTHKISLRHSFNVLKALAPRIVECETLTDILELYDFDEDDWTTIHHLDFIFKGRKHKLKR